MKIYLAGGMHTNWQQKVKDKIIGFRRGNFYDPMFNGGGELQEYVTWDLLAVKKCDVVFAYMEEDNPGGYGMIAEIGYAKGLGKTVVFVCENDNRYFNFVKEMCDTNFDNLKDGIEYLQKLILLQ